MDIQLTTQPDVFKWGLAKSGLFLVKSMYLDYMDDHTKYHHKYLWKIRVPIKIEVFMWFLHNKVLVTKDNLIKRKWQGSDKCCFCDHKETMQHLFLRCTLAKMVWRIVYMAFSIIPAKNIKKLFGNWLVGVSKIEKAHIRVRTCALLLAIWRIRNDYIFNNAKTTSFMHVIPLATHWICMWSFLQSMEK
jgi:hypothetical protein